MYSPDVIRLTMEILCDNGQINKSKQTGWLLLSVIFEGWYTQNKKLVKVGQS